MYQVQFKFLPNYNRENTPTFRFFFFFEETNHAGKLMNCQPFWLNFGRSQWLKQMSRTGQLTDPLLARNHIALWSETANTEPDRNGWNPRGSPIEAQV